LKRNPVDRRERPVLAQKKTNFKVFDRKEWLVFLLSDNQRFYSAHRFDSILHHEVISEGTACRAPTVCVFCVLCGYIFFPSCSS
jgi:hypothetical protein